MSLVKDRAEYHDRKEKCRWEQVQDPASSTKQLGTYSNIANIINLPLTYLPGRRGSVTEPDKARDRMLALGHLADGIYIRYVCTGRLVRSFPSLTNIRVLVYRHASSRNERHEACV